MISAILKTILFAILIAVALNYLLGNMYSGIVCILIAIIFYFWNIFAINKYNNNKVFEEIEKKGRLPKDESYEWEKTAGKGIVPKWVSLLGLSALPLMFFGIILLVRGIF